jgi:uncharacterized protein (TIGR02118 family)
MAKLIATYQQPTDPAAFDAYYHDIHVPLVKSIPGLRSFEVSRGDVMGMAGKHGVYMIGILDFDTIEALGAGMASQGQATVADLANFAMAGADAMIADTVVV